MLEDGACVGAGAYLAAHEMTLNGKFKRGPIIVGADCTVGPSARLTPHVTVEAGSNVPALVCALPGQTFRRRCQAKGDHRPMPPNGMPPGPPPSPPAPLPGPPVLPRERDEADDRATPGRHQRPRANSGAGARTVLGAGAFATPTVAAASTTRAALTAAPWQALVLALVGCVALTVAAYALHARRGAVPRKCHDQRCARCTVERATSSGEKVWEYTSMRALREAIATAVEFIGTMGSPIEAMKWAAPSVLTITALLCGLSAVRFSAEGEFDNCIKYMYMACVLDGLDGHVARALGTSSAMGFELDSLCDLANFGVCPALVVHFWLQSLPAEPNNLGGTIEWAACCAHAACCSLRLARFNVEGHAAQMDAQHGALSVTRAMSAEASKAPASSGFPLVQNFLKREMYFTGVPAPIGAMYALAPITLSLSRLPAVLGTIGEVGAWAVGRRGTAVMLIFTAILMMAPLPTLSSKMLKSNAQSSHLRSRFALRQLAKALGGGLVLYAVFTSPMESFLALVVVHGASIPLGLGLYFGFATNGKKTN